MMRYDQLRDLIDKAKPRTILEIGTHNAVRACMMCVQALQHRGYVHYTGYDLFEDATAETNKTEMNGKGPGSLMLVKEKLASLHRVHPGFAYRLVKGNTRDTLHGRTVIADFVFIDGGHSVETIRGDYEAVKSSKVIVFDDYYLNGANTSKFGCNEVIKELPHTILPHADSFGGLSVKMAVLT